jgi:hypothetical protein
MPTYALSCSQCDQSVPVGIAQAGSTVRCAACGANIDVPGTKGLRVLPLIEESNPTRGTVAEAKSAASWWLNLLAGLSLAVATIGLGYGSYLAYLRWNAPIEFGHSDEELYAEMREKSLSDPPVRTWDHWQYLVETGLPKHDPPLYFVFAEVYKRQIPWMIGSLTVGALGLLAFIMIALLSRKSDKASAK